MTTANTSMDIGNIGLGGAYALSSIPEFPISEWNDLQAKYATQASWYSGSALLEKLKVEGVKVDKFPVRINPIPATVLKHSYALFGEVINDARPLVLPRLIAPREVVKESRPTVKIAEETLNNLWWENFGRTIQAENGILSQVFGGCVFVIRWVPWERERTLHIKIEKVDPRCFMGSLVNGDEYRLQEMWIVKPISKQTAAMYGYTSNEPNYFWIEHWTQTEYHLRINSRTAKFPMAGPDWKNPGQNEFGFVPGVYIPHSRAFGLYGDNVFDGLTGIIEEINLRTADYGDAVSADSHNHVVMSNVTGTPQIRKLDATLSAVDLGNSASITGGEHEPRMYELGEKSASGPMRELVEMLEQEYRRFAFLPPIADGEDEGSQRSGETLLIRMWPLISHTNSERLYWGNGLDWLTRMMLTILRRKGEGSISDEHLKFRTRQEWAPILPKDRTNVVNEGVNRMSVNLGSPQHLLEMLGDVEDEELELEQIKEWLTFLNDLKIEVAEQTAARFQEGSGGGGTAEKGSPNPRGANSDAS